MVTLTTTPERMKSWLESAWLARYLDRQLSSEETTWFESYALDKPELLAAIEADTGLRDALASDSTPLRVRDAAGGYAVAARADLGAAQVQPAGTDDESPVMIGPGRAGSSRSAPVAWMGLAASLLIGLGTGWFGNATLAPRDVAPALVANPTRIIFDTLRGEVSAPRIEHADSASPFVLVEVAVPPGAEHITLKLGDAPAQALNPTPDGFVNFFVRRKKLAGSGNAYIEYTMLGKEKRLPIALR